MSSPNLPSFLREKVAERISNAHQAGVKEMLIHNWYLGFTAFGGPAVHFQIVGLFLPSFLHCLELRMSARSIIATSTLTMEL